jgi:hypothetical protein
MILDNTYVISTNTDSNKLKLVTCCDNVIATHDRTVMISGNSVNITGGSFIQENQISVQKTYIGKQGD